MNKLLPPSPRFRSLRWQLPLSYAAIALLAVLALGVTLLGMLRDFYREQEIEYLTANAEVIAGEMASLLVAGDQDALQAQITGFSFLTQTRIEVLDDSGEILLADSGEPAGLAPAISVNGGSNRLFDSLGSLEEEVTIVVEEERQTEGGVTSQRTVTRTNRLPAQGSLYGFALGEGSPAAAERSDLSVQATIMGAEGEALGRVHLSGGPAYGVEIVRRVAWGWAIAGTVAVLLAALSGFLVSRRLTRPLGALTAVTGRMADGDLSARAQVGRADELGLLGRSFNRMAAQVEQTVNSLRQFSADAAHELNTPLTALQTDLQLLEAVAEPAQQRRAARALDQARRLQALADSLLELSRLEAEAAASDPPFVDLTQLVQRSGELYASRAEQTDLDFELALPDEAILTPGDELQLRRALANVLENSLKFTPPPGTIVLSLVREADTVAIGVRDSGIGIPPEDLPQLTSRFYRGRNTAGYAGSGLGLAIVQAIMARHQGQVTIDSGEWGTSVRLILPVAGGG